MKQYHHIEKIKTKQPISIVRLNNDIENVIEHSGFSDGFSMINEHEPRLLGSGETIPLINRKLQLGQYQSIFLLDLGGPRERTVNIQIIGDVKQAWR